MKMFLLHNDIQISRYAIKQTHKAWKSTSWFLSMTFYYNKWDIALKQHST